jgi:hypothetical protein
LAVSLLLAPDAPAFTEPVTGGTTTLTLELPKKVKPTAVSPATANGSSITLQNTGGTADASRGTATIDLGGGIKLKGKGGKADLSAMKLSVGPSGQLTALVKGKQVGLATVGGAELQPGSLQAVLQGATATLTEDGAKALNRALGKKKKKKGKGKASASASGAKPFREGRSLGTVSTTAALTTVPVRAVGEMVLEPELGAAFTFMGKGINALPGFGGISPVSPATAPSPSEFDFPVTGGRVSPQLTGGQFTSAGGLLITKNQSGGGGGCDSAHPIGTFVKQTDLIVDLDRKALLATLDSSGGFIGAGTVTADLDMSGSTATVNPDGSVSIEGMVVRLTAISATTLNSLFGRASEGCGADFAEGDSLGHLSVTTQLEN